MDQNNQQEVNTQEQEQEKRQAKRQTNGSAGGGKNNHNNNHQANGKCQSSEEEMKKNNNSSGTANGNGVHSPVQEQNNHQAADQLVTGADAALLPHLESIERLMKLPVVEATWHQGQDVYGKVKGHNAMFNWAFKTAENVVKGAVNITAPLVQRLDKPIQLADQTLVKQIDKLEVKAPIIKEQPQEIYNQAKCKVIERVQPHLNKVCSFRMAGQQKAATLKELSWAKANEVLATQYGTMAVSGVDSTAVLAERLLDYYFPRSENDVEEDASPISAQDDPVLHTVQTVGRLSNKIARRVYNTVSRQVKQLKKEDVQEYVASLIAVLRLTQYLNFINEKMSSIKGEGNTGSSSTTTTTSHINGAEKALPVVAAKQ